MRLKSPYGEGDCAGRIAADALLEKIEAAQVKLQRHGREWERSPEPPWEGQEEHSLKVLGFPGITRDDLYECLVVLYRIACYVRDHKLDVQWS